MSDLTTSDYARIEAVASRIALNCRHITIGIRPDDDPAERARQTYYRAHERWAIARDIQALATLADWSALEPVLRDEAEQLRQRAAAAPPVTATTADPSARSAVASKFIDVPLSLEVSS